MHQRKKRIAIIAAAILAVLLFLGGILLGRYSRDHHGKLLTRVGLSDLTYTSSLFYESHIGFHNDGVSLGIYYEIAGEKAEAEIAGWERFSDESIVTRILYGGMVDNTIYASYLPAEVKPLFSDLTAGSYLLLDEHGRKLKYETAAGDLPLNFVLAVYNAEDETLYVLKSDL